MDPRVGPWQEDPLTVQEEAGTWRDWRTRAGDQFQSRELSYDKDQDEESR